MNQSASDTADPTSSRGARVEVGPYLLSASGLACQRDDRWLFTGLALGVRPGHVLQIEGPNGSGKTTLLRILCGLTEADSGAVYWQGESLSAVRSEFYGSMVYVGHQPGIKHGLTPRENLQLALRLSGGTPRTTIDAALERLGLGGYQDLPCRGLSAGQQRRVTLARLLLVEARLWVMDEPFTAMDRAGRALIEGLMRAHVASDGAVLVTTHHALDLGDSRVTHLDLGTLEGSV